MYFFIFVAADYDLTGQLVWPGAVLLNNYLSKNADMLEGRSVIELGSGVGRLMFICPCLGITDDNDCVNLVVFRYHRYTMQ